MSKTITRWAAAAVVASTAVVLPAAAQTEQSDAAIQSTTVAGAATVNYTPNARENARNAAMEKALNEAIQRAAADAKAPKALAGTPRAVTTIYYDDSQAPSYNTLIDNGAAIWNSRVRNVRLVQGTRSNATLIYREGNDSGGSYYYGNGHGSGTIFLDYNQMRQYAPQRIVTHETGHALGLPDRYSEPCSKLMSGGGPGPSCTNPYPDSVEASRVDTLWAYGFGYGDTSLFRKAS